jgi:hypothetical protein
VSAAEVGLTVWRADNVNAVAAICYYWQLQAASTIERSRSRRCLGWVQCMQNAQCSAQLLLLCVTVASTMHSSLSSLLTSD